MSQSTDRFIELHTEFQDAHSKYKRQGTGLYLAQRVNSLGDDASVAEVLSGGFNVIGTFPIPIIDPSDVELFDKTLFKKSNDRAVGQGTVQRRKQRECVAFMPSRQRGDVNLAEPGAAEFCRLAEKAGRMLPKSIRDVLPWKFEPSGFAGRWLAAMFWHKPPEARQFRSYNRKGHMDFKHWPFSESTDVIEDFGLLTGSPQFRTSDGKWPAWAGFLPDAAASNGIATKFSAPQSASDQETDSDGQILSSNQVEDAPKGISLLDVALLLNENDLDAARATRRRWYNSKAPKLPEGIGKDCEDSRAKLYSLSSILEFVKTVEVLSGTRISRLRSDLRYRIRKPRNDETSPDASGESLPAN